MPVIAPRKPPLGRVNLSARERDQDLAAGRTLLESAARKARVLGRYKARGEVPLADRLRVLRRLRVDAQKQARAITGRLIRGELTRDAWQKQMRAALVPAHYAAALAASGSTRLDPALLATTQSLIREQLGFLGRFRNDLATGITQPDGRALLRADLYGAAVTSIGEKVRAEQAKQQGHTQERGVLGATDHCESCLGRADQGWQPIGTLLPIGDGLCRTRCACHLEFRGAEKIEAVPERIAGDGVSRVQKPGLTPVFDRSAAVGRPIAEPVLPGRPFPERLAAYSEGDGGRKLRAIIDEGSRIRPLRRDVREAELRVRTYQESIKDPSRFDDRAEIREKLSLAIDEANAARQKLDVAVEGVRAKLPGLIGVGNPQKFEHKGRLKDEAGVREARAFVEPLVAKIERNDLPYDLKWNKDVGGRAYSDGVSEVFIERNQPATAVHEMAHVAEGLNPRIFRSARDFLSYRVGDEVPVSLGEKFGGGLRDDELGRKDRFDDHLPEVAAYYAGKEYKSGRTELVSMGLEELYKDPTAFATNDPEWATWLLGALDGSL